MISIRRFADLQFYSCTSGDYVSWLACHIEKVFTQSLFLIIYANKKSNGRTFFTVTDGHPKLTAEATSKFMNFFFINRRPPSTFISPWEYLWKMQITDKTCILRDHRSWTRICESTRVNIRANFHSRESIWICLPNSPTTMTKLQF